MAGAVAFRQSGRERQEKGREATSAASLGSVPALHYKKQEDIPQRSGNRRTACVLPRDPQVGPGAVWLQDMDIGFSAETGFC